MSIAQNLGAIRQPKQDIAIGSHSMIPAVTGCGYLWEGRNIYFLAISL